MFGYVIGGFTNYLLLAPIYIIVEILLYMYYKKRKIKQSIGFIIGWQIFVCLFLAIFSVTGTAGVDSILKYGADIIRMDEINLVPFWRYKSFYSYGIVMNVILFVPVGILMPMLWESSRGFFRTVLGGFLLSLLIELSQLFNFRVTDIDDLLMNTLGAAVGYLLYTVIFKRIKMFGLADGRKRRRNGGAYHAVLIFMVYFFIAEPVRELIYKVIYG